MTASDSSNRLTLWSVGQPNASYSGSCQPEPTPRISRPSLTWSRVAAIFASSAALRNPVHITSVPSSTRLVASAIGREDRPALVDAGRDAVEAEQHVVEHPDRVEAELLGTDGDLADLRIRQRAVVPVLFRDGQHDSDPHPGLQLDGVRVRDLPRQRPGRGAVGAAPGVVRRSVVWLRVPSAAAAAGPRCAASAAGRHREREAEVREATPDRSGLALVGVRRGLDLGRVLAGHEAHPAARDVPHRLAAAVGDGRVSCCSRRQMSEVGPVPTTRIGWARGDRTRGRNAMRAAIRHWMPARPLSRPSRR